MVILCNLNGNLEFAFETKKMKHNDSIEEIVLN